MTLTHHLSVRVADDLDLGIIATLAHATWPETYGDILSPQQIEYMLGLFYSEDALRLQMSEGHRFFIAEISSEPVGFTSFSHDHTAGAYKLHKLYVHPLTHGKGVGSSLLRRVIEEVRKIHGTALRVNVNRHNRAKNFYENAGFAVVGEEDIAIGEGYFMNDYVMEKDLVIVQNVRV